MAWRQFYHQPKATTTLQGLQVHMFALQFCNWNTHGFSCLPTRSSNIVRTVQKCPPWNLPLELLKYAFHRVEENLISESKWPAAQVKYTSTGSIEMALVPSSINVQRKEMLQGRDRYKWAPATTITDARWTFKNHSTLWVILQGFKKAWFGSPEEMRYTTKNRRIEMLQRVMYELNLHPYIYIPWENIN